MIVNIICKMRGDTKVAPFILICNTGFIALLLYCFIALLLYCFIALLLYCFMEMHENFDILSKGIGLVCLRNSVEANVRNDGLAGDFLTAHILFLIWQIFFLL